MAPRLPMCCLKPIRVMFGGNTQKEGELTRNLVLERLVTGFGAFLIVIAMSASVHAGSLRQVSSGTSAAVTGSLPWSGALGLLSD